VYASTVDEVVAPDLPSIFMFTYKAVPLRAGNMQFAILTLAYFPAGTVYVPVCVPVLAG
jgi:hypothetical protein